MHGAAAAKAARGRVQAQIENLWTAIQENKSWHFNNQVLRGFASNGYRSLSTITTMIVIHTSKPASPSLVPGDAPVSPRRYG